jgi:hypothetical protein
MVRVPVRAIFSITVSAWTVTGNANKLRRARVNGFLNIVGDGQGGDSLQS